MPIVATPTHQPGDYPDTVRHVANGDPANQTFLANSTRDLEFRTDVIKTFANALEATVVANFNTLSAFDANHDHSGSNGEKLIDFAQLYANSNAADAFFSLAVAGRFSVKKAGGGATLFSLKEDGLTPKLQIQFPNSDALFDHQTAPASNKTINPHGMALAGRLLVVSEGCLVDGLTGGPYTEITLNAAGVTGTLFASPGLAGKSPSDGATAEGALVGDLATPGAYKLNAILIRDNLTGLPILHLGKPVYGLLVNTGTLLIPVWELSFFADGVAYSFATDKTVSLYGNEAFSLSTVPVVDPRFLLLAQKAIAV